MAEMFNPPHPGETLREDVLPALKLSVKEAAEQLGVTRATLSRVLHGHAAISPEMALRIEKWLGKAHGGEARLWLELQAAYDLWQARLQSQSAIARIRQVKAPARAKAAAKAPAAKPRRTPERALASDHARHTGR